MPETFSASNFKDMGTGVEEWITNKWRSRKPFPLLRPNPFDIVNLQHFARCEGENVELLIGIEAGKMHLQNLNELVAQNGGRVTNIISAHGDIKAVTALVPIKNAHSIALDLLKNKPIKYVEPNFKVNAFFAPNDQSWMHQWGPRKVKADYAWNVTLGSSNVLVAIIDSGIDYTHPDLAPNYVPLGFDWANNDPDPLDDFGHGTHCAGIVAAVTNNSIGIAGLAQVRIMAEKALSSEGFGYYSWVANSIYHAVDAGAQVISMSFGGPGDSEAVHDALKYAYNHGVLLVAAAGNEGNSLPYYPAAYEEVIAVSATDASDIIAQFSSFGMWIELAAPGVNIYSTMPTYHVPLNEPPFNMSLNYDFASGTSMACPHVTGVAALVWSTFPDYPVYKIRQILRRTADDLGDVGFDEFYGYGRVNAERAVVGIPVHDLAISEWQHSYGLRREEIGVFNVTVANHGRSDETNISIHFFVNQTLVDVKTISFLETEMSISLIFLWGSSIEGNYNVTCRVVPLPDEDYLENNVVSSIIFVRPSAILRVPSVYPTIKEALNNAVEGDVILVEGGSYSEGQIDIFKDNITLQGLGTVTLNGLRSKPALRITANFVTVAGFTIQNSSCGIYVQGCSNNITGNYILNQGTLNGYRGIHLFKAFNSTVCSNTMVSIDYSVNVNVEYGILVESSSSNIISLNKATNAANVNSVKCYGKYGITLYLSSDNMLISNNVSNSHVGIWLYFSSKNTLISNLAENNWSGIILDAAPFNTLRNNIATNNTGNFGVRLDNLGNLQNAINDVDSSNLVGGKPVYYWINVSDAILPLDAGCVILVNCQRIKIQNLLLSNNLHGALLINTNDTLICSNNIISNYARWEFSGAGILLAYSSNNTVYNNNISYNAKGVWVYSGVNNTIIQNEIIESGKPGGTWGILVKLASNCNLSFNKVRNTNYGAGICLSYSSSNVVSHNIIELGVEGLTISYYGNLIHNNTFIGCSTGMTLYTETANCIIKSNSFINCGSYSIYLCSGTNGNIFFHNNFIGNTRVHTEDYSPNVWDNGYPSGGNYWSDYSGIDEKCGADQNLPGSDGLGDTPYTVYGNVKDRYPLMAPWAPEGHDIAIVNVLNLKTIVGQGLLIKLNILLLNKGEYSETFNAKLSVNATVATEQTVTLEEGDSILVVLIWDTSSFARGNYILTIFVEPVPGETNTSDNTFSFQPVKVTIPGDLDGDYSVLLEDLVLLAKAYGSRPGDPNWNINADIEGNGVVGLSDLVILAKHYGET